MSAKDCVNSADNLKKIKDIDDRVESLETHNTVYDPIINGTQNSVGDIFQFLNYDNNIDWGDIGANNSLLSIISKNGGGQIVNLVEYLTNNIVNGVPLKSALIFVHFTHNNNYYISNPYILIKNNGDSINNLFGKSTNSLSATTISGRNYVQIRFEYWYSTTIQDILETQRFICTVRRVLLADSSGTLLFTGYTSSVLNIENPKAIVIPFQD